MPGVVVTTAVRTGPALVGVNPAATFFVAGQTERGPSDEAVQVVSLGDFESKFGGYVSYGYVHSTIQTFFEEGGSVAYVSRVVGASATTGSLVLNDSSANPTLTLYAAGAGAWSNRLTASVTETTGGVIVRIFLDGSLVFRVNESSSAAQIAARINASALAKRYVRAVDEGGGLPVAIAPATFSSGNDDRASVTNQSYVDALDNFKDNLGAGAVAIPGLNGSVIWDGLIQHANTNHRMALGAFAEDTTSAAAMATAADYSFVDSAEHMAFFYPWVTVRSDSGITVALPPEGYVAAKRSLAFNTVGAWQTYAGLISEAKFVNGTNVVINKALGDELDEARVNALRIINGRVRVYGARTVSLDEDNFRFINSQEMLNYVVVQAQEVLEDLVFSPIDGRQAIFSRVRSRLVGLLEPIRVAGGFYEAFDEFGERVDFGYTVRVDSSINPVSQLADGLIRAKIGMRVSSVGDKIEVEVTKSNLTASVV